MMGPCVGTGDGDPWCDGVLDMRGLNAAMLCDTPSAKMNCSRSSMLVRPLADRSLRRWRRDQGDQEWVEVVVVGC